MKKTLSKHSPKKVQALKKPAKQSWLSRYWQLGLFLILNLLIFTLIFNSIYSTKYSAVGLYFTDASKMLNGALPYRDFTFEYPPLSALFFILPRLITAKYLTYSLLYHAEVVIFLLVGVYVVFDIGRRLGKSPWKLLSVYTLCVLAIGPILGEQFDIFAAVMMLLSVYFFWLGKTKTCWVFLALGILIKLYPVVIAPVFLFCYLRNHQNSHIWKGILSFALTCLVVVSPVIIVSPGSLLNLISYHSSRGLQLESTYSAVLMIADKMGLTTTKLNYSAGAWNVVNPVSVFLAQISTWLLIAALLIVYWFIYKQIKPGKSQFSRIGAYSALLILVLLIFSKILSPQYLIWLLPVVPLIFVGWRNWLLVVFITIGLLTYFLFPLNYLALMAQNTGVVIVLFIRDLLLVGMAVLTGISLYRMKASD